MASSTNRAYPTSHKPASGATAPHDGGMKTTKVTTVNGGSRPVKGVSPYTSPSSPASSKC
jgi:hypothetical protein